MLLVHFFLLLIKVLERLELCEMYFGVLHDSLCVDNYCLQKNIYVADLTEELVKSLPQALAWIRKGESKI